MNLKISGEEEKKSWSPYTDWYFKECGMGRLQTGRAARTDGQFGRVAFLQRTPEIFRRLPFLVFFISRFSICCIFGKSPLYPQDSAQCTLCFFLQDQDVMWNLQCGCSDLANHADLEGWSKHWQAMHCNGWTVPWDEAVLQKQLNLRPGCGKDRFVWF